MLRRVFHKTSDDDVCLKSLCADETPQRGVNDDFVYTSSHTAQGLGLTVTVHLSQKPLVWHIARHPSFITCGLWLITGPNAQNRLLTTGRSPIRGAGLNLVFLFSAESGMRFESSVGLAHNSRVSHPHDHYEWLQYGLIWADRMPLGATYCFSFGLPSCYLCSSRIRTGNDKTYRHELVSIYHSLLCPLGRKMMRNFHWLITWRKFC